jgi:hypothetical protein
MVGAVGTAGTADLQLLKRAFPQYKTNSLLYALRRHKFDGEAAVRTLLTSSNTRFWREFHSCGHGLVGVGEVKPARQRVADPALQPPQTVADGADSVGGIGGALVSEERNQQQLADEIVDQLLATLLNTLSPPTPDSRPRVGTELEPEPETRQDTGNGHIDAPLGQSPNSEGLGAALDTYRCALKLSAEKRYYESIPLLEKCLEVFEKELPPESSHTVRAMARLMADYKSDSSRASRVATASTTHSPAQTAQGCS